MTYFNVLVFVSVKHLTSKYYDDATNDYDKVFMYCIEVAQWIRTWLEKGFAGVWRLNAYKYYPLNLDN